MDSQAGDQGEVRWLSYSQIAALRGISRTSAERMVRRAKWRRQVDNQGVTKAAVPLKYAEPDRASPPDSQAENPPEIAAFREAVKALEAAVSSLTERSEAAEKRADQAEIRVEWAENRADQAEERSDRAVAQAHRAEQMAEDLLAKLDRAQAELATTQDQAEAARREWEAAQIAQGEAEADAAELRQADAARRSLGRLARLRAAWRGE
jgi:chromosome segregation ATPase